MNLFFLGNEKSFEKLTAFDKSIAAAPAYVKVRKTCGFHLKPLRSYEIIVQASREKV
jgi:hypothetical protein